ncbi:MAG: hypothetical protein KC516_02970 [Nanoarchaeota archaeon]|nr:hypothetical protein [Nanoarchaeota archaeon]
MKPFEYYIKTKEVRKISKDIELAKSLIKDMQSRIKDSTELPKKFKKLIFENYYDALRNFCDALLAKDGYKSYSHQASIIYLSKYNFSFIEIQKIEDFRYLRNSSKYYGKPIEDKDLREIKKTYQQLKEKINKIIKKSDL